VVCPVEAAQDFAQEVVHALDAAGDEVCLLNPVWCSSTGRSCPLHTKTDRFDALATWDVGRA
jgi:hypothetical protein